MKNEDLVRMVNQIAAYFRPYPQDMAFEGIAGHVRMSWTPRMRAELEHYIESGAVGLDSLAIAALARSHEHALSKAAAG